MTKNVFLPRFFLSPLPFAGGSRQAMQVRRQIFFQPPGDSSSRVVSKHRASVIDERGCDDELATGAPGAGERRGEGGETQARGEGTSRCFRDARAFSLCPLPGSSTSAPMAIPRALFRERPRPPLVAPRLTPAFPRARTATSRPTAQGDKKKKAPAPVPVPAVAAGTGGSATGGKKHKLIVRSNDPPGELLEELAARFVLNCPAEELNSFERILFLVEQAHWYYEDFVREENKNLRSMKLREFAELTFHRCAALSKYRGKVDGIYKNFLMYKLSIPTAGLVILNPQMDKVLMVKGWNSGSSWGFPKGKINKNEPERECAAREVFEEVGVDFSGYTNEEDSIVVTRSVDKAGAPGLKQRSRLFIVPNISEETCVRDADAQGNREHRVAQPFGARQSRPRQEVLHGGPVPAAAAQVDPGEEEEHGGGAPVQIRGGGIEPGTRRGERRARRGTTEHNPRGGARVPLRARSRGARAIPQPRVVRV
jgi:8-oxo-dGTP pyrophosphatase MutT (NUDIX family)